MEILVLWFILSLVIGAAANSKGRNPAGWFLLSILLSPLLAGLFLLAMGQSTKQCEHCGARIQSEMRICNFCGNEQEY